MRKIFIAVVFSLFTGVIYGQESFVFRNTLEKVMNEDVDYSLASYHYMGDEIANRMYLFKKKYTHIVEGTPMSPVDKEVVKKPDIYFAVRKLSRHYKKQIRKDNIEESEAKDQYATILEKAIAIYSQDTENFEAYLKKNRKPDEVIEAFEKVVLQ